MADEIEPLVDQSPSTEVRIVTPKRTIVIEPLLIVFTFFSVPSISLSSQYILTSIRAELGANSTSYNQSGIHYCNASSESEEEKEMEAKAQSEAAYFQLYMDLLQGIPCMFVGLFLGNYSDKAGRKYSIVPPLTGMTLMTLCYVIVISLNASRYYLFIGAAFNGLGGYFMALLCGCLAYVADTTSVEKRTLRITIVEMCMILPATVSTLAVGYWIRAAGYLQPYLAILAGQALCIIYSIFFIPDSFVPDQNAKFFSTSHLRNAARVYFVDDGSGRHIYLLILLAALFGPLLVTFSAGIDILFEMNLPLCWDSVILGIYSSVDIAVVAVGGIVCAVLFRRCLSDLGIVIVAGVISTIRLAYKSFVQNTLMMFLSKYFICNWCKNVITSD